MEKDLMLGFAGEKKEGTKYFYDQCFLFLQFLVSILQIEWCYTIEHIEQ